MRSVIDFHCHLDLYPSPREVVDECRVRGVRVLSVTTTPSVWKVTSALVVDLTGACTALGLHPQLARERQGELHLLEALLPSARFVGEVGLDGDPQLQPDWDVQVRVFSRILEVCARAGGRVISVHSKLAAAQVIDLLSTHRNAGVPVLHWFSGAQRDLDRAIKIGCWFSVGPGMLRGSKGRRLAGLMPRGRVLTETDGPFCQLDGKPLMPWDVSIAEEQLAEVWGIPLGEVRETLTQNWRRLVAET